LKITLVRGNNSILTKIYNSNNTAKPVATDGVGFGVTAQRASFPRPFKPYSFRRKTKKQAKTTKYDITSAKKPRFYAKSAEKTVGTGIDE